jgi:hypothetical protein
MGRACSWNRVDECIQGFGWKDRKKRPLVKPSRWWENNIKMDLREIGRGGTD